MAQHIELKSGKLKKFIIKLFKDWVDYNFESISNGFPVNEVRIIELNYEERAGKYHWKGEAYSIGVNRNIIPKTIIKWLDDNYGKQNWYQFELLIDNKKTLFLVI